MSHQSYYSMDSNPNNEGYSVMHSYPFINDGPKINNVATDYEQKQISTTGEPVTENCIKQVPPGVLHIKPTWKPVKLDEKPPFSYATIIAHAILSSEHRKLTLSEIYQWISEQYPCYSMKDHRWQNSIRHNLSLQKAFAKLERDATTPSGKGCFWTILPGYEQQFIDNLVKRGLDTGGRKQQQPNNMNHTTSHKQFKKFIDSNNSSNKASSHLFTIFRMNPSTPTEPAAKRVKKSVTSKKPAAAVFPPPEIEYDSDCDSGVGLDCENFSIKKEMPTVFDTTDYTSLLAENSMFVPEDMFATQQQSNLSAVYFDDISTPSSIIDQNMFDPSETIYWPTTNTYSNMEFSSSTTTTSSSYGNDLYLGGYNHQDLFLQHPSTPIMPNEDPSSYLLYNDYC